MARKLLLASGVLAVVVLAGLLASWLYVRGSVPAEPERVVLDGLAAPVEVLWTEQRVPYVRARTMEDLSFAVGWLHARERLFQMEVRRRVGQGRLAELFGEGALRTDVFLHTVGIPRLLVEKERRLCDACRRTLEAYAAGVNAWLADRDGPLPPEFLVLGVEPEPWRPAHSLALEKTLSLTLASYGTGVAAAEALRTLGPERASWLFPDYPDWAPTMADPPPVPEPVPPEAVALLEGLGIAHASNAWVIDGSRTAGGKPILANDPHLSLEAPGTWYLMGLHADDRGDGRPLDVVGVTLAGAPFVVLGHNRAIAWGMTNATLDDADFFIERLDPADPTRYLTPDGSRPFEVAAETIRVKGRDAPEIVRVRRTRHGPVVPTLPADGDDRVLAVQWTALRVTNTMDAVWALNRAENWEQFRAAVDLFDDPHQNTVYADTAGHIGFWMGGTVPVRGDGRRPPIAPVPGWTGEWDWTGELPLDRRPHVLDPPWGFVVTANQRQALGDDGALVSSSWEEPFRAIRITEMVQAGTGHDADAVHRMQLDVRDAFAARYRDRALAAARDAGAPDAAAELEAWDLHADVDSHGAALFYAWYEALRRGVAEDLYGRVDPGAYLPLATMRVVFERRALPWADDGAARYRRLAGDAVAEAARAAAGRTWGELHGVVQRHQLGGLGLLDRVLGLNIASPRHPGSSTTVNVAHYARDEAAQGFPVAAVWAASMRHVVDMADLDGAGGFVLSTGQSGNPFSRHYDDQFDRWREGGLLRLPLDPAAIERVSVRRTMLEPAAR